MGQRVRIVTVPPAGTSGNVPVDQGNGTVAWGPQAAGSVAIGNPVTGGTHGVLLEVDGSGNLTNGVAATSLVTAAAASTVANNDAGYIDVMKPPYNAKFDNSTDDTAAIQSALNDASLAWYGLTGNDQLARVVQLPPGRAVILGTLTIPTNVWLRGHGKSATYLVKTGAGFTNAPVIQLATNGVQVKISSLGIISSVTSSTGGGAISLTNGDGPSILADQACTVEDVVVYGHYDGIVDSGTENRYLNVHCYNQQRHGFFGAATDGFFGGCTAANSGQANSGGVDVVTANGFAISGPNTRLYGCKAFGALGKNSNTSGGFAIGGRCELVGCEAQDCQGVGFTETGAQISTYTGCLADSCGQAGFLPYDGMYSGCVAVNRGGKYTMPAAIVWGGVGGFVVKGLRTDQVRRVAVGTAQPSGVLLDFDSRFGTQAIAYAATVTPDPWLGGDIYVGTLTGAVTIANPQSNPINGTDGVNAWYQQGQRIKFVLTQDATGGRAITLGTAYHTVSGFSIPTTASSTSVVEFEFDGTVWRQAAPVLTTT